MKKFISLVLGLALATGASIAVCADSPKNVTVNDTSASYAAITPRRAYESEVRTLGAKKSWTSSKYYCVSGDRFGGGSEDPVTVSGKIQYSTTVDGPWKTLSTKSLNMSGMAVDVTQKGYYRFVLTNNNSYSVTTGCYVIVD